MVKLIITTNDNNLSIVLSEQVEVTLVSEDSGERLEMKDVK